MPTSADQALLLLDEWIAGLRRLVQLVEDGAGGEALARARQQSSTWPARFEALALEPAALDAALRSALGDKLMLARRWNALAASAIASREPALCAERAASRAVRRRLGFYQSTEAAAGRSFDVAG